MTVIIDDRLELRVLVIELDRCGGFEQKIIVEKRLHRASVRFSPACCRVIRSRACFTAATNARARSTTTASRPAASAFTSTSSEPTPSALAPAARYSAA